MTSSPGDMRVARMFGRWRNPQLEFRNDSGLGYAKSSSGPFRAPNCDNPGYVGSSAGYFCP